MFLPALLVAFSLFAIGCSSEKKPVDPAPTAGGHDHDHAHHHEELGPNGGHLLALGDSGYQAEWIHEDEAEKIIVHILDEKKQAAEVAYSVSFETVVGETTNNYALEAVKADSDGLASEFTITNGELLTAVQMAEKSAEAAKAVLITGLQNGEVRQAIEVHDHEH
jgi:hypothetical protein